MRIINREYPAKKQKGSKGRYPKYAFGELTPGQCLEIDVRDGDDARVVRTNVASAFRQFMKFNGYDWNVRVAIESVEDGGHAQVVRAYRIG